MPFSRRTFTKAAILSPFAASAPWALRPWPASAQDAPPYAITVFGDPPKYPADFPHWNYVDPDAPKGGTIVLSAFGSFDTLNYFNNSGVPAVGVIDLNDSLVVGNSDEGIAAYYMHIAESFEEAPDGSWLTFTLRDDAYFHDGRPITAEDVAFTHAVLREKGTPVYRARFYRNVQSVEALDARTVKFTAVSPEAKDGIRSVATFPVLPKHWWETRDFAASTLEPPLGSAPYRIAEVDPGRSITYERVPDYWARDLPQSRGLSNFDVIRYDYYRDTTVENEAFKAGAFDFNEVVSSQDWAEGFKGLPAIQSGKLKLEEIPSTEPANWVGFLFNLRRPQFQDVRVRRALTEFYDFETARRTVHYNMYQRVKSYFPNTEMAATGLPTGDELAILEPFRGRIPDSVFAEEVYVPTTDGSGNIRPNLRRAMALFAEAGWQVQNGVLTNQATGRPMRFEIMYQSANIEKVINPLVQNFRRGGIQATARLVDPAQFTNRLRGFDFDLIHMGLLNFYPPNVDLVSRWHSSYAETEGSENFNGLKDPVMDELLVHIERADSWDSITAAARAVDRYAMSLFLGIPTYWNDMYRLAYWDIFARPGQQPRFGYGFPSSWWYDPTNTAALRENR